MICLFDKLDHKTLFKELSKEEYDYVKDMRVQDRVPIFFRLQYKYTPVDKPECAEVREKIIIGSYRTYDRSKYADKT